MNSGEIPEKRPDYPATQEPGLDMPNNTSGGEASHTAVDQPVNEALQVFDEIMAEQREYRAGVRARQEAALQETSPVPPQMAPQHAPIEPQGRWWRRTSAKVTALVSVTAVAAATAAVWVASSGETVAQETSPTVPVAERSSKLFEIQSKLALDDKAEIQAARKLIPEVSASNPRLEASLNLAADYAVAMRIFTAGKDNDPSVVFSVSDIHDPSVRGRVETVNYTFDAHDIVSDAHLPEPPSKAEVEAQLNEALPDSASGLKEAAEQAVEGERVKSALDDFAYSEKLPADIQKLQGVADQLDSAEGKQVISIASEDLIVSEALQDFYLGDTTPDQARAVAATIQNPTLRANMLAFVDDPELFRRDLGTISSYSGGLSNDAYNLCAQFTNSQSQNFKAAFDKAVADREALLAEKARPLQDAQLIFSEELADAAGISPSPSPDVLEQEANPREVVDLTGLESTEVVPNFTKRFKTDDEAEYSPDTYAQFGEMYAKDGKLVLEFEEGVSARLKSQYEEVMDNNMHLIEAAFASGSLVSIRFAAVDEYAGMGASYSKVSRETIIRAPKNDDMSLDQLSIAATHELTHSLLMSYFEGAGVTDAEHQELAAACVEMRSAVYEQLQTWLATGPTLQDLRSAARPEHQAIIDTLIKAVSDNTFAQTFVPAGVQGSTTAANQCNMPMPDPNTNEVSQQNPSIAILEVARAATPNTGTTTISDLNYLITSAPFFALHKEIEGFFESVSVFSSVIDEANYVQTLSADAANLGHSRENADELFASLLNAALNYRTEFDAKLETLDGREYYAVMRMLGIACSVLESRHPSLQGLTSDLRQYYELAGAK